MFHTLFRHELMLCTDHEDAIGGRVVKRVTTSQQGPPLLPQHQFLPAALKEAGDAPEDLQVL